MRDWDKELAKVDQAMAKQGNTPVSSKSTGASLPDAKAPSGGRRAGFYTWVRLSLALILGVGMTQWPYLHGCGFPLFAYLGGAVTVIAASIWSMISSWRSRSTVAHFLSVGLLFWGSALSAREILPRVGYAKQSASWMCAQPGQPNPATPPNPAP
jgi:hypothetical protein